jgi:Tol biopolymer transport system component
VPPGGRPPSTPHDGSVAVPPSGARRASGGNTKWIVGGLLVALLIGAGTVSAIVENLNQASVPGFTDDPGIFVTDAPGPVPGAGGVVPPVVASRSIVFRNDSSGDGDLYAIDPVGNAPVQLTSGPGDDHEPALSPDGTQVAFSRIDDGGMAIWLMSVDGSGAHRISDGEGFDWQPAWMPDGRIVFSSNRFEDIQPTFGDLWVMGSDGSNPTLVAREPGIDEDKATVDRFGRVAFASDRGDGQSIYLLDQGTQTVLTGQGWRADQPAFAPDGDFVLVTHPDASGQAGDIWSIRLADLFISQLTSDPADERDPVIVSDGSFAFARLVNGSYHLIVRDPLGERDLTGMVDLLGNSDEPTWR